MAASGPSVDTDPVDTDAVDGDEGPLGMSWSVGRVAAVVTALVIVVFWAWIFSGAPKKDNPDFLQDRAYAGQLEDRCQQLREDLAELPSAIVLDDPAQRVDVLDDANVIVASFVDDLEAGAPTVGGDATSMKGWIADWRTYVADREDYADRLRADASARMLLDASPLGDPVDKTIEVFAEVNRIDACATPGDVG